MRRQKIHIDESRIHVDAGEHFAEHQSVNRGNAEYGRGTAHTNTIEGVFCIFNRGMKDVCPHSGKGHLHCDIAEFDFRFSNRVAPVIGDTERADKALPGVIGERLACQTIGV